MRRLLVPLIGSMLLLAACGGSGGAGSTAATPASAPATESMTDASMSEPMTESMAPSASPAADDMHPSMSDDMHPSTADSMAESVAGSATDAMTESMTDQAGAGVSITTASSAFGEILFDGNRQAIYLFDKETTSSPGCDGECAEAWPPVLTSGPPVATGGISAELLGTTTRSDGSTQVTYANHPLYYYAGEGPGEVTCHDVREFGGLWLVVTPTGEAAAA